MPIRPALLILAVVPLTAAAPIEVAVSNVTQAKGRVHVDVCSQKQFLTSDCVHSAEAPAVIGTTIVTVPNVPPGAYAVQVFHDLDGDGKLKRGLFGVPKEPVGFSRDAPIHFAPPHWQDAMFDHGGEPQRVALKLRSSFF